MIQEAAPVTWPIANAPDLEKRTIPLRGLSCEVNSLKRTEGPRELRVFTGFEQKRHDPGLVAFVVKREHQLVLDPVRLNRVRTQYHHEPSAPFQRRTDFIMPLLRPPEIRSAIPNGNIVSPQDFG